MNGLGDSDHSQPSTERNADFSVNESAEIHPLECRDRRDIIEMQRFAVSTPHIVGYALQPRGLLHHRIDSIQRLKQALP